MGSGIDIQLVKDRYKELSDDELIQIATQDAYGLTPEALEIVKEEVQKRQLDPNIIKGVDAQQIAYTAQDIDEYCELIRDLPCPITGSTEHKLNATMTAQALSAVLFTSYKKKIVVGSPGALDKKNNAALAQTLWIGWWGFPWGPIRTIQAIRVNMKSKKTNWQETPNDYLRSFVLSRIGEIETYKDDKKKLQQIIADYR